MVPGFYVKKRLVNGLILIVPIFAIIGAMQYCYKRGAY
jgi:hypothetical protein